MISHAHRCIFIHIPKTAGTSIEKVLGHFDELKRGVQDHRPISVIEPLTFDDLLKTFFRGQIFLLRRQLKKVIHDRRTNFRQAYDTYFKFTIVRNPWARVFSWYQNVMRDELHQQRFNLDKTCTFQDFLNSQIGQFEIKPQLYWILDKKKQNPLNFVGRFEKLKTDFEFVATRIGLKDFTLPSLILGSGERYTQHYDTKMRDLVFKFYREEINRFNFEYGE